MDEHKTRYESDWDGIEDAQIVELDVRPLDGRRVRFRGGASVAVALLAIAGVCINGFIDGPPNGNLTILALAALALLGISNEVAKRTEGSPEPHDHSSSARPP